MLVDSFQLIFPSIQIFIHFSRIVLGKAFD